MAYVYFVVVSLCWGVNFLLMKNAVQLFTPGAVAVIRVTTGAFVLGGFVYWRARRLPLSRRDLPGLCVIVLLGYAWPFFIQPYLIPHCGSGLIGIMPSLVPLLTLIIAIPLLGSHPSARQVIGVLGGLCFTILLLNDGLNQQLQISHLLIALTVPVCYALSNTYIRRRFSETSPVALTFWCLAASAILLAPQALYRPLQADADHSEITTPILSVIALGVFGTGLALVLFTMMIQSRGPLFAGMVTYVIPVIAVFIGGLDGESIPPIRIASLLGILSMVALVQWPRRRSDVGEPWANHNRSTD